MKIKKQLKHVISAVFCKEINEKRSMDVIEIDAASHTGVDNVRENIIENSRFYPLSILKI